ncbi:MAG: 50S ribosomal protein L6 [Alphaproteobacteria bacterium]|nr:50S ribosomal protein L6 [Alphaproteobacteria bacterium]MBV8549230.1 50S ribosomal protein L6 [Alphaproteobacteria bacterium]
MSRVGKYPVALPQGVSAEIKGDQIAVKGKNGTLSLAIPDEVEVQVADSKVAVAMRHDTNRARVLWGTTRNNIKNMVQGVTEGFKIVLEIEGVGFRAAIAGKDLVLQLGFSHEIKYPIPEGISMKVDKQTVVTITGNEKQRVGQVAAEIRGMKKPEPYKGKGIKYEGERIRRKEGKKK